MSGLNDQPPSHELPRLAAPARRALAGAGIERLEQLTGYTEAEIGRLHGMGPHALDSLRQALATNGLSFAESPVDGRDT